MDKAPQTNSDFVTVNVARMCRLIKFKVEVMQIYFILIFRAYRLLLVKCYDNIGCRTEIQCDVLLDKMPVYT